MKVELALRHLSQSLSRRNKRFTVVGGLAVSVRAEVERTPNSDVALAVAVQNDAEAERLVRDLCGEGYEVLAALEHDTYERLSAVRFLSPAGIWVDLIFASTGIEDEITRRATVVDFPVAGTLPVARAEELLAMKVLAMTDQLREDRLDAQRLLRIARPELDLSQVRENLWIITARGFDRGQDLDDKLAALLEEVA